MGKGRGNAPGRWPLQPGNDDLPLGALQGLPVSLIRIFRIPGDDACRFAFSSGYFKLEGLGCAANKVAGKITDGVTVAILRKDKPVAGLNAAGELLEGGAEE